MQLNFGRRPGETLLALARKEVKSGFVGSGNLTRIFDVAPSGDISGQTYVQVRKIGPHWQADRHHGLAELDFTIHLIDQLDWFPFYA